MTSSFEAVQMMDILADDPFTKPSYNTCVIRSPGSPFGQIAQFYEKAWQQPAILAWVKESGIDLTTVTVRHGQISASVTRQGSTSTQVFCNQNKSWRWEQAQIVDAAAILDPKGIGLPCPGRSGIQGVTLSRNNYPYNVVLAFYGYTPPTTQQEATAIARHILDNGKEFPLFTMLSGVMGPSSADFRSLQNPIGMAVDLQKIHAELDALGAKVAGDFPILIPENFSMPGWISAHPDSPVTHLYKPVSDLFQEELQKDGFLQNVEETEGLEDLGPSYRLEIKKDLSGNIRCVAIDTASAREFELHAVPEVGIGLVLLGRTHLRPGYSVSFSVKWDRAKRPPRLSVTMADNFSFQHFCNFYGFHDSVAKATLRKLEECLNHAAMLPFASQDRELGERYENKIQAIGNHNNRYRLQSALTEIIQNSSVEKEIKGRARRIEVDPSSSFVKAGCASCNDGTVVLADLMAYRNPSSSLPATDAQVNDIIRRLSFNVPAPSRLGDYRRLPHREPTAQNWSSMASVMRDYFSGTTMPCLGYLGEAAISGKTECQVRASPDVLMEKILNSPRSRLLAKKLLGAIGWYGGVEEEKTSRSLSEKLLLRALIRHMDLTSTGAGITEEWLRGGHQKKPYAEIRTEFEAHLRSVGKATAACAPLVAHALLGSVSPDLLVRDVPRELTFRSHGWVVFRQGVELAEFLAPGSSRSMGYEQLISLATEPSASESICQFMASAAIAPVLEWASANGVLPANRAQATSSNDIDRAIDAYIKRGSSLQKAINTLNRAFSWKEVAKEALMAALDFKRWRYAGFDELEGMYLRPTEENRSTLLGSPTLTSWKGYHILDVYMAGYLKDPSEWLIHSSATDMQKRIWGMLRNGEVSVTNIETLKLKKLDPYVNDYVGCVATVISESFVQFSTQDRKFLAWGNLKFYRAKKEAVVDGFVFRIEATYGVQKRNYAIRAKDMTIQSIPSDQLSKLDFEYVSMLSTAIFGLSSDAIPSHEDFGARARIVADYLLPKDELRASLIGQTALERDLMRENRARQIVRAVVDTFNPVSWYEDLKSDNRLTRIFGGLGFVGFAGGIFTPAVASVRGGVTIVRAGASFRIAMPQVGRLVGKSTVSMVTSLNPADGVGTLFQGAWKLGSKAFVKLTGTTHALVEQGAAAFKRFRGLRPDDTLTLTRHMETHPAPISAKQIVDGMPDVSVGRNAMGSSYTMDTVSGRLLGPPLAKISRNGRLSSQVHDTMPAREIQGRYVIADNNAWPEKSWLFDKDTHSMVLMSDSLVVASYRFDVGALILRKVDSAGGSSLKKPLKITSCRGKRAIDVVPCGTALGNFQTAGFTTDINFDAKDYMPWFGQERFTPAQGSSAFVRDGKIYTGKNGVMKPVVANEIESLGSNISPIYRERINATIMGGSPDFKQIRITGGVDARVPDTREISAFVAEHHDTGKVWIVTEADTRQFYFGEVPADGALTMKRVDIEDDVLNGTRAPDSEEEELAVAMRGSLNANAHYRMYPTPVVLEKSIENLERLLLENHVPDYLLGKGSRFKYATTDAQAIMHAPRPRLVFNAHINERLGWPSSLPVDSSVLTANSKFYADALNELLKKPGTFTPTDFITGQGAGEAAKRLKDANNGKDSAVAWVRLVSGKFEVHYAGFDVLNTPKTNQQAWMSADRFAGEPYVDAMGMSLPPLAQGHGTAPVAGGASAENRIFNAIFRDHPAPGTVVEIKLWVAGTRDPAAPFFYQSFINPGVHLRVHDPASGLPMADVAQMRQITPASWQTMEKSTLPAGVQSAIDDDLAFAGGIPYVYTWKDGRKSYVAWEPEEKTLYLREGEGSSWYIPERYNYQELRTWQTPSGKEPTLNTADVASGRNVLVPERLESAKQAIRDGVLLPPVSVTPAGEGKYVIVDGNHRLQAARDLGLQKLPYLLAQ
ncbi:TPA: ParB N-terminal domain-containing protein [Pseudomonas putida]|nr:ParB N-terminal domain-containing protein [Pseudomonas putida]